MVILSPDEDIICRPTFTVMNIPITGNPYGTLVQRQGKG